MSAATAANLRPFTSGDPRASEAGKRSAANRRARRELVRANYQTAAEHLDRVIATYNRDSLGAAAAAAALDTIARVTRGEIPIRHASDAAELVRALVDIARLEAGQPTSASLIAHLSSTDARARLAELRQLAGDVLNPPPGLSTAAVAADDTPGAGGGVVAEHQGDAPEVEPD